MDKFDEIRDKFSNMKLYQLERLVRKDYNKYEQEVYLLAVEELKKKTSDEYVRNIFNELNNKSKSQFKLGFSFIYSIIILAISFLLLYFSWKYTSTTPSWGEVPNELINSLQILIVLNIITGIVAVITNKYFNVIVYPLLIGNIFICVIGMSGFFMPLTIMLSIIPFAIAGIVALILGGIKDYFCSKNNFNKPVNEIKNRSTEKKVIIYNEINDNEKNIEMKEKCHKIFSLLIVVFYIAVLAGVFFTYESLNIRNIGYVALEIVMAIIIVLRCREIYFEVVKNMYKKTQLNIIALVIFSFFSPMLFSTMEYLKLVVGALVIVGIIDCVYRENIRKFYENEI